ncbi:serine hydrolase domain-containing protein [Ramlibacter albus]|uniref:Serine hydrolase n=1 Tax=Ramlibacter albus TaxID=2079448 RepID=A0A923M6W9_9BURK|nr:serine hydrolase [Ramlibacter albus]MBC5763829.1 serine hydrolase [Ramlibacter albus]
MGRIATAVLLALLCGAAQSEPDEVILGKPLGYPVAADWYSNPNRVGSWSAMHKVPGVRTRVVSAGSEVQPLRVAAQPAAIRYRFNNVEYTLDDYLERQRVTGLIVMKDGEIVVERYRYGRTPDARFLSFSMAKSVTSLLVGMALERGLIASLDDPAAKYARELEGSPYGATTVRQLLRMSSGLVFTERYDGADDVARMVGAFNHGGVTSVLKSITARHSAAGEKFVYASGETQVLGRVLKGATGKNLSQLTQEWLWQPLGAERDALWMTDTDGNEGAFAYFNASLRDWARLGLMLARDGRVGDKALISREYLLDATDLARQPAAFQPGKATPFAGYGYQFWLLPLRERTFAMWGVHGQGLFVQPATGIVMVHTAAFLQARDDANIERAFFWYGVLRSLGGRTD